MRVHDKSAASAEAIFHPGVSRSHAWKLLTRMFSAAPGVTISSLVPGSYALKLVCKAQNRDDIGVGDVFRYDTHSGTHHLAITEWKPEESFAYDEASIERWKDPCIAPSERDRMRLIISERNDQLILSIRRSSHFTGAFGSIFNRVVNRKGYAFAVLDSLVGPASANATAYAGAWKALPIRLLDLRPDEFHEDD